MIRYRLNVTFLSLLFFKLTVPLPHCTWGYYLETDPDPIAMVIRVELFTHMSSETNINWHCMGYSCTTMLQVSSVCWARGWIAWLYLPWWQFGLGWFRDNTPRRAPDTAFTLSPSSRVRLASRVRLGSWVLSPAFTHSPSSRSRLASRVRPVNYPQSSATNI